MSGLRVFIVAGVIVAVSAWLMELWLLVPLGLVAIVYPQLRARLLQNGDAANATASGPRLSWAEVSADVGEELLDLLLTAMLRSRRLLEDEGRLDPFVVYETAEGQVKGIRIDERDPALMLARARVAARAVDCSAPRVILAVQTTERWRGRPTPVVRYEAAERGLRERTYVFVQRVRPRRLFIQASTVGRPVYVGDAAHSLRLPTELPLPT